MNKKIKETVINIGTGKDYSIKQYANLLLKIILPGKKLIFNLINLNLMELPEKF